MRKTNEVVDIKATVPFLLPATIMIAVAIIFNIAIFDSVAASPFCKSDADQYAELIRLKPTVSPAQIAESYALNFTTKGAGREAQAVWRRMSRSGETLEQAIEAHFKRYHADKSEVASTALRRDVTATVGVIDGSG